MSHSSPPHCIRETITQMAAYLVRRAGGTIALQKLALLMYLADRRALAQYGEPVSYDGLWVEPNGLTLQSLKDWLRDGAGMTLGISRSIGRDELSRLSDVDLQTLEAVHQEGLRWSVAELVDIVQTQCPEWEAAGPEPGPVEDLTVLIATGVAPAQAELLATRVQAERLLSATLETLG